MIHDPFTWPWWAGTTSPVGAVAIWTLAAVAVSWLRYDATVWSELGHVLRRQQRIRDFIANARDCDRCAMYWLTAWLVVPFGPGTWLAVNGAYLLLSIHLPSLTEPDDNNGNGGEPERPVPPPVPAAERNQPSLIPPNVSRSREVFPDGSP